MLALHVSGYRFKSDYFQMENKQNPKTGCQIILKSYHFDFLKSNIQILQQIIPNLKIVRLPTKIKKWTVIRSPHVHKKSREQFEIRTYSTILILEAGYDFQVAQLQSLLCTGVQMQIRYNSNSSI